MKKQEFIQKATSHIHNPENIKNTDAKKVQIDKRMALAKTYFENYELATLRASYLKYKALENSDKLLTNFEYDLNNTKVKVSWATDSLDAIKEIYQIAKQHQIPVCFDNSDIVKELIPHFSNDVQVFEKTNNLNSSFIALTKADFICADSSSIICLNQDNQTKKIQALAQVQIFVCGIDSVLQSFNEIELIAALQSTNKYGEPIHSNINIYNGNKINDNDVLEEDLYVILLDNGRSQLLADSEQREVLNCIHCDSCTRACPVALHAGIEAYGTVYTGPYGSLVSNAIENNKEYTHLVFASTLDAKINEVCPMRINLTAFINYSRRNAVKNKLLSKAENMTIYLWKNAVMKRSNMDKGNAKIKSFLLKQIFRKNWGDKREMPIFSTKSFNQIWRERKEPKL